MEITPEYIEFEILDSNKFDDLVKIFSFLKEAKNTSQPKSDDFWVDKFPNYTYKHFFFLDSDVKPDCECGIKTDYNWHFFSMVELLQTDLDVKYLDCKRTDDKGILTFISQGYPYGGTDGLLVFLKSFDCHAELIDEGAWRYKVNWKSNGDFNLTEIKTETTNDKIPKTLDTQDKKESRGLFSRFFR